MKNLTNIGRVFFGIPIAGLGILTMYDRDFPYMLIPPNHFFPGLAVLAFISGALLVVAGGCIVFEKKTKPASLLVAGALMLIFCFYFIPYQLMASTNYMHFGDWENAAKEVALASGALVVASCYEEKNENALIRFLTKLIPYGAILFAITIISFSINHFLYSKEAADYVPSWIPGHLFWIYFGGAALFASGLAILIKVKAQLAATLLGVMIFTWFIILHVPRIIVSPIADLGSEITSALIALAYSGVAFVIAGTFSTSGDSTEKSTH